MKKRRPFARKRFGQHFLSDPIITFEIINSGNLSPEDHVIEIGPGRGVITEPILKSGAQLSAVEIDRDLAQLLKNRFSSLENFSLVEGDVLQMDWEELIRKDRPNKIIANLPYNISTPIFFQFVQYRKYFDSITIMIQKEVADRIAHKGLGKNLKEYGILSVIAGNTFKVVDVCDVPATSFNPPPKVESKVIRMVPLDQEIENEEAFFRFVRMAFNQRRKVITTFLKKQEPELYGKLSEETREKLHHLRPENILPHQYLELFRDYTYSG